MSFNYHNNIVTEDMERLSSIVDIKSLDNKTVLITGITGMLAKYCVFFLCYIREKHNIKVNILALGRNKDKVDNLYSEFYEKEWFTIFYQDICDSINYNGNIDYVFHLASNASPYYIQNDPVGIIRSNILGTLNILELSRTKEVKKIIFASTREVYGKNEEIDFLSESDYGVVDPLEPRACYPESKRAAETIFKAYNTQYGIPFNSVRIAHSYGPGMNLSNDGRVMADFMCNAVNGENIVIKSVGTAERAFCYITDTISAMFIVLLRGEIGRAYNIANEKETVTIKELAYRIVKLSGNDVVFDIPKTQSSAYCNYRRSGLNTTELEKLGWEPLVSLNKGLELTYNSFKL